MTIAKVRHEPSEPTPIASAVVGGDTRARDRVAGLLATGFSVGEADVQSPPALLLLVLDDPTDALRVAAVRALAELHPDAHLLAIMPASVGNASMRRVLLAGASGIVLDDDLERTLVPTAHATLAGQLAVPAALGRQIAPRPLSYREQQILALVMRGRTNREIARELYLAESTVKTHLSSAFRKLDARSRSEAIVRIKDPDSGYGLVILDSATEPLAAAG
jgi:DNA-binding NarL/FixJ family response regulator